MIDTSTEQLLTFADACDALPRRRRRRKEDTQAAKTHPATIWRWAHKGIRGVTLETIVIGGQRMTSAEALQRFFERVTAAEITGGRGGMTARRRKSRADAAARELEKAGI